MASPDPSQKETSLGLEDLLNFRVQRLASKMTLLTTRDVLKRHRLGISEWRLICRLVETGPQKPTAISQMLGLDLGRTSRLLKAAEKGGLISKEPDPKDGRSFDIHLMGRARLIFDEVWPVACSVADEFRNLYSTDELEQLNDLLDRSIDYANSRLDTG